MLDEWGFYISCKTGAYMIGKEPAVEPRILLHDASKIAAILPLIMLIHGDNLLALKALEQEFAGRVKCIYKTSV